MGVPFIIKDDSQWINKHGFCFFKTDTVFLPVTFGFLWIPVKLHVQSIT